MNKAPKLRTLCLLHLSLKEGEFNPQLIRECAPRLEELIPEVNRILTAVYDKERHTASDPDTIVRMLNDEAGLTANEFIALANLMSAAFGPAISDNLKTRHVFDAFKLTKRNLELARRFGIIN